MENFSLMLIVLPLAIAFLLPFNSIRVRDILIYIGVLFLVVLSSSVFFEQNIITIKFSHVVHLGFIFADIVLIFYFLYVGLKNKNKKIWFLAALQFILFVYFLSLSSHISSSDILIDKISSVMLLIVNIIGSIIIIYSIKYIQSEEFKQCKKNGFLAILFFFIAVMNLLVMTNNIEIFFLAFELTTLCSYILIRYRGDKKAKENSLKALWMNQIGGVAILLALIISSKVYDTVYIDIFLLNANNTFLAVSVFLIIAAFVKGASIPFEKWLLGAMVAPTPVSAILHSATMVKIAPYLVLKISSSFDGVVSILVMIFGSFVFMAASAMALSKDYFKEILGLSTIALLGLMMCVAAVGTQEAIDIALILMVFHAISKALLFLQAGVMEKEFGLKYLKDMNYMVSNSKLSVFFIIIGFASLTLPPFGAFIGKFQLLQLLASMIEQNIFTLLVLVMVLMGSVFLTLLYFKVLGKFLTSSRYKSALKTSFGIYNFTSSVLVFLLLYGVLQTYYLGYLSLVETLIPLVIVFVSLAMLFFVDFKSSKLNIKVVNEYNCGEKDNSSLGAFYFNLDKKYIKMITFICISLILVLISAGLR